MSRNEYYNELKQLARDMRTKYSLNSPRVLRTDLRRIYREEGIRIDIWPHKLKGLRGAYFNDEHGPTVMLAKGLPEDPMVFTMGHELKHHLVDSSLPIAFCDKSNELEKIEIGAEVFAAELIFPEAEFTRTMSRLGFPRSNCTPEHLVRLKRETRTTLSYAALAKRAEFFEFCRAGTVQSFKGWKKLEEQIYGVPLYKQILIRRDKTSR